MPLTIPSGPDEETPLLGGKHVSDVGSISEPDSEDATLAGPSNQGSRTPSIKGKANTSPVKKTPLPWAQFSIVLFLQLAEPLTSQVIYPVSSTLHLLFWRLSLTGRLVTPSLHLRSVWLPVKHPWNQQINPVGRFHVADTEFERCKGRDRSWLLCWNHGKLPTRSGNDYGAEKARFGF